MTRLLFVSPDSNSPIGGVKVIYRHVELLQRLGYDAQVMHFQRPFRCGWFENTASVVYLDEVRTTDLLMVPEIMTTFALRLGSRGVRYCMFVQNGYLVLPSAPPPEVWNCYKNAAAILSISQDTSDLLASVFPEFAHKIVRVKYSVDAERFQPRAKQMKCTYMPRKLRLHSANVVPWLTRVFPGWTFEPIHNMTERQVAEQLATSRVFLAFSDVEGCPLPPIEAALCGNVVVGYPGWGGCEYWGAPNFQAVPMGHMRAWVDHFRFAASFALLDEAQALLAPGIAALKASYGPVEETRLLLAAMAFVEEPAA